MTDDQINVDLMDYASLTQNALKGVIRQALQRAASPAGLPGEHHFYITFLTRAPGVSIPEDLMARYPFDITIVVQHQYRDLRVLDDLFRVTLTFGGAPKILTVPYAAITRFYDPFAKFMLDFEVDDPQALTQDIDLEDIDLEDIDADEAVQIDDLASRASDPSSETRPVAETPKIVSLDQFRKK